MAEKRQLIASPVIDRYPAIEPRSWQLTVLRDGWEEPVGIWEIVARAREEEPGLKRDEILRAIERLMALGLVEAGVPRRDGEWVPWSGARQEIVRRIERAWIDLGRDPWLGDLVYFALTPAGLELAEAWPLLRFSSEPRGDLYRTLLEWVISRSGQFVLVVREDVIPKSPSVGEALARLRGWRVGEEQTSHWPGMFLLAGSVTMIRHRSDIGALEVLTDLAGGPFDWIHPSLPEALSFLDATGRPFFVNNPRDRILSLDLAPRELDQLLSQEPQIGDLLDKNWSFHGRR